MAFFEKNKDNIWSKYTLKRTKLHRFKKFSRGGMPPNPPSNAQHVASRHANSQIWKKNSWPPPLPNPGDAPEAPQHLQNFMPNNSRGVDYYPIRNPRWQPPMHVHTFITGTCRYQLPMILNDLNSNDIMSEVIKNINNVSLLGFKRIVKTFLLDRYSFTCNIPNCYVCG